MKVATVLAILAFAASSVTAEPVARKGKGYGITSCGFPGSPCFKDKREAAPEPEARRRKGYGITSCGFPGGPCFKDKRDADADADPEAHRHGHFAVAQYGFSGKPKHHAREAEADPEADPEARRRKGYGITSCGFPGGPCFKAKRAALAVAEALAEPRRRRKGYGITSCGFPGGPCFKAKRDAEAEAEPRRRRKGYGITSCGFPGGPCFKARRALEDVSEITQDILNKALYVDEDEVSIAKRDELVPYLPSADDEEADTDADATEVTFSDEDNYNNKVECFAEDGECETIENAQGAFHASVKRDARRKGYGITSCGFPGGSCARDVAELEKEKVAGNPEVLKAEEECYAPDGECTAAEKHLEQLENALEAASEAFV